MKLLIVEDESLTRDGLCKAIPYASLGIDEILLAEDGKQGLAVALRERPDILLTDVRMPQIRGDRMASDIRKEIPDISIIFISGFSDKEYLKSAVKVGAIDYVEKPIDPQELSAVLRQAVDYQRQRARELADNSETQRKLTLSLPALRRQLAIRLIHQEAQPALQEAIRIAAPGWDGAGYWRTFLLVLIAEADTGSQATMDTLFNLAENPLNIGTDTLAGQLEPNTMVIHAHSTDPSEAEADALFLKLSYWLRDILSGTCRFVLLSGMTVNAPGRLHESFQSIEIMHKRAFFMRSNTVLLQNMAKEGIPLTDLDASISAYRNSLRHRDRDNAAETLYRLGPMLREHTATPGELIRRAYVDILHILYRESQQMDNPIFHADETEEKLETNIMRMPYLFQMEELAAQKTHAFFAQWPEGMEKSMLSTKLNAYLADNFSSDQLSLHSLSARFNVSESHLCVVFRKAYATTINQRITQLRIEKARGLLTGTDLLVKTVSQEVGYPDCNSFIKLFKRQTGLTPQEYRERKGVSNP